MKTTLLASALLVALTSVAIAAPVAPPKASVVAPNIDSAAVALLDKSVAAYAQTPAFSQSVKWEYSYGDRTGEGEGTWDFQRPNRARLEKNMGEQKTLVVGNDKTRLIIQGGQYVLPFTDDPIAETGDYLFVGTFSPLGLIFRGINPLEFKLGTGWQSATLAPDGQQIILKSQSDKESVVSIVRVRFDPQTHLITRVEHERMSLAPEGEAPQKLSNIVTLTSRPTNFAPDLFEIALPAGKTLESLAQPLYRDDHLTVGAKPFALKGKTLAGEAISLDDYWGKVVLIDFWGTWCSACKGELPTIRDTYRKYHEQGFEIISVSCDEEEATLRAYLANNDLPWHHISDDKLGENSNKKRYGVRIFPTPLLIGKDGVIAAAGAANLYGWHLPLAVEAALAK